ncbi:MAG: 2-oxoglutarate dehydrogenase E1 component [Phycisphaerales bacterium JB043]
MSAHVNPVRPSVNSWSGEYLEAQYQSWKANPASVSDDLASFFQGFDLAQSLGASTTSPHVDAHLLSVHSLVRAYRTNGHLCAELDPFGRERDVPAELRPQHHGLTDSHLEQTFTQPDIAGKPATLKLRELIEVLDNTYCRNVAIEYMHVENEEERNFFRDRCESSRNQAELSNPDRAHILLQLHKAEMFETFLHKRYVGQKRFSLEGAESLIPLLDRLLEQAADDGVSEVVMGMAHRGRLNVLNNILGKSYEQIFTEFEENWEEDFVDGGGDVKYHLGFSGDRTTRHGNQLRVVLSSNPSHLESVNGVVEGRCRAKQRLRTDADRSKTIPVLIHGDAAVIAQGPVLEVLNYSQLPGYCTGGTIHVVVNNMVGFTTGPEDARTSRYCTDIAKTIDAPIIHVNAENPEAVVHASDLALEYRQLFKKDVFIDMWCYRRWGHNEGDDPSFTQPIMAALIKKKPSTLKIYAERLLSQGVISETDVNEIRSQLDQQMERAQSAVTENPHDPSIDPGSWRWQGMSHAYDFTPVETGASPEHIKEVAEALTRVPEGFNEHKTLKRILTKRAELITDGTSIDWGAAETLAFGTLLLEGKAVRVSGQDSRRGTFSHRHAVLRDTQTGERYIPLNSIRQMGQPGIEGQQPGEPGEDGKPMQARLCCYDSPLSEAGVLAFEYGYSLADPNMLVIWEAQFGDFANGAQVIVDQYIASAEIKWQRWSGLVLLLPHSYEGQGPEHSSARLERYLKLCADDNLQVVYPTTPAQCFHMLRRQVAREFRKPLIVMSPKSLLRLPECTSSIDEFTDASFQEIIDDPHFEIEGNDRKGVHRILLCSGKVYYDLARRRDELERNDIAIIRIEQIYPLHEEMLDTTLAKYPDSAELVWVQEEPRNAGAYHFFNGYCMEYFEWDPIPYIGRPSSATPATGSKKKHAQEQEEILTDAVGPLPATKKNTRKKQTAKAGA